MKKIIDIPHGKIMAAFDIHGNWEDYQKIREKFNELRKQDKADILLFGGDLIHERGGYEDKSVEILDDLIKHPEHIALLGNHELMHIYHLNIHKNSKYFASELEEKLKQRDKYIDFMKKMPFAIRTAGGVLINHTGAFETNGENIYAALNNINHDEILDTLKKEVKKYSLEKYGTILSSDTFEKFCPLLGEKLLEKDIGELICNAFFSKNEYDREYPKILNDFLRKMSRKNNPLNFLVSGHIQEPEGYRIIADKQLRISSSYGANPGKKTIAMINAGRKYETIEEIVDDLERIEQ